MSPTDIEAAVLQNDTLPSSERMSNRSLAASLGINEASVRRARKRLRRRAEEETSRGRDKFFSDLPVAAITKRGTTRRLADGSYEKVEWRPGAVEAEEARRLSYEDLKGVFDNPTPPLPQEERSGTLVICLSDWQVGKTDHLGGSDALITRVTALLNTIGEAVAARGGYDEIILADVGDAIEGFGNVVSQQQTNDLSLTDQIRITQRLFAEAIKMFAPMATRLWFVTVPSNHCRVRTGTGSKAAANAPDDDFGLLIHDTIRLMADGREGFEHVNFVVPGKWEEALTVMTNDGSKVAFTHGHLAGSQNKVPEWFRNQSFGRNSGLHEADILVYGHFHNFSVSIVGDNRFVIGCPTADNGSSWFTNRSGASSLPAMLTFEVQGHRALGWRLWYGE